MTRASIKWDDEGHHDRAVRFAAGFLALIGALTLSIVAMLVYMTVPFGAVLIGAFSILLVIAIGWAEYAYLRRLT